MKHLCLFLALSALCSTALAAKKPTNKFTFSKAGYQCTLSKEKALFITLSTRDFACGSESYPSISFEIKGAFPKNILKNSTVILPSNFISGTYCEKAKHCRSIVGANIIFSYLQEGKGVAGTFKATPNEGLFNASWCAKKTSCQ